MRALLVAILGAAAFLLNPLYACESQEEGFQYGATEMKGAVEGVWELTVRHPGQKPWKMTFRIEQGDAVDMKQSSRGWIRSAAACGDQTLVRSAHACLDVSTMPLRFIALDGGRPTAGHVMAIGKRWDEYILIHLSLTLPHGSLGVWMSRDGKVLETSDSDATLVRRRA